MHHRLDPDDLIILPVDHAEGEAPTKEAAKRRVQGTPHGGILTDGPEDALDLGEELLTETGSPVLVEGDGLPELG